MSAASAALICLGGEMELDVRAVCAPAARRAALPAGQLVQTGRTALKQIARAAAGKRVLLPAYLCPSMLQPFHEERYEASFYPLGRDLNIEPEELERCSRQTQPDIVLFINYFGFPQPAAALACLARLRANCLVVEDCAHGSLLETSRPPVGQTGDFVITSFRKYLPVPDGGLLISRRKKIKLPPLPEAANRFVPYRLLAKMLRREFIKNPVCAEAEACFLALFAKAEEELDAAVPWAGMSAISRGLFDKTALPKAMRQRRRNFKVLLAAFSSEARLRAAARPLFTELPPGVSPLFFPIRVANGWRDELRGRLRARRIYCPVHWQLPAELNSVLFAREKELSHEILSLPLDQRYGAAEMEFLVRALCGACKRNQ